MFNDTPARKPIGYWVSEQGRLKTKSTFKSIDKIYHLQLRKRDMYEGRKEGNVYLQTH